MYSGVSSPNRTLTISLLLMAFFQNASADSSADSMPDTSVHFIGGYGLILDNREAQCILHSKVGDQETNTSLDLQSPCYWISSAEDEVIDYDYLDVGVRHTLLIAGTPLDWNQQKKQYQKMPDDQYCTKHLQGLVITDNGIHASASSIEAPNCVGQAIDEKVFYGIAHDEHIKSQTALVEPAAEVSLFDTITQTLKGLFSRESAAP